jgi:hypothetical protein
VRHTLWLFVLLLQVVTPVSANENNAWQTANDIRQALFAAQGALLDDNVSDATYQVAEASRLYPEALRPLLADELPDLVIQLDADLNAALFSAQAGDPLSLAFLRGRIWAGCCAPDIS